MPVYACHTSVSCHVSPEAKLRMLYLMDITRHSMKEWFKAALWRGRKREGENVNIFRRLYKLSYGFAILACMGSYGFNINYSDRCAHVNHYLTNTAKMFSAAFIFYPGKPSIDIHIP